MYHLAANPEFIGPLREEMERVIAAEGWTKTAMGRMWRLDSFLRESQRVNSINPREYLPASNSLHGDLSPP